MLEDYPEYPYQSAFAIDELRQKLIAHVISQIPHQHTIIEDSQKLSKNPNNSYSALHQRLYREMIIRGSMLHLLRENADWVSCQLSKLNQSGLRR